ncbi:hypothetical protein D9M72_528090 [compost metagenome]
MGKVGNLVGDHGAAAAGVLGPAIDARLVEGAVDDQLMPAGKEVKQAFLALGALEDIFLRDRHPRHAPALCSKRIASMRVCLFPDEQVLSRFFPGLL